MRKRLLSLVMAVTLCFSATTAVTVSADSATVVSIGADLSTEQKDKIFEYFGVKETDVAVIEVNNDEERKYLEGVATEKQIGKRTFSCAYIEETEEGKGINVKTANLTWVTSNMIKSTLTTAGIYDCNVVAAAPFAVSGTGALTGILKAFEIVTGSELDEDKKEIATEEIVISGNLAEDIGSDEAVGIITDVKNTIIGENIVAADKIEQVIIDASTKYEVTLTDEQVQMLLGTMVKIAEQDYDYERLEGTFNSIMENAADKLGIAIEEAKKGFFEKIADFFKSIFDWFKNLFSSNQEDSSTEDNGILDQTDESILGDDVITDSTVNDDTTQEVPTATPEVTVTPEPTPETVTEEPTVDPTVTEVPTEEPTVEPSEIPSEEEPAEGETPTDSPASEEPSEVTP